MSLFGLRSMFNALPSYEKHDYECYRDEKDYLKRFVNLTIDSAMNIIENMDANDSDLHAYSKTSRLLGHFKTEWPTCGSVNSRNGLESVQNEMSKWNELAPLKDWMFHVSFIGLEYKSTTEFYSYQVLWSVPTPAYPEPQVTVSVFFCIAASRVQPPHFPVDVMYLFEGHQFVHRLSTVFRAKWLYDILDVKTMMFKTIDF